VGALWKSASPLGKEKKKEIQTQREIQSGAIAMEMLTKSERDQVEARLTQLIANRPVISQRIAEARALGDLKENGDYHAAREQQGMEEAEIKRLKDRLADTSIVDDSMHKNIGIVFIGATVRMAEANDKGQPTDDPELFKLVGEAAGTLADDITEVTATSPMGEALMKARVGELISVRTPRGVKKFKIIEIL
jgi:transcription elongation factor GreA